MSDEDKSPEVETEEANTEAEGPATLTGSSVHAASVAASSGTHGGFASGGMVHTSGGWTTPSWATYPSTGTGTSWGGTLTPPPSSAKKPSSRKMVNLPPRFTKKVLVAVIDPDEEDEMKNVIWAAQLVPISWEIRADGADGRLVVEFSLEDVHGNLEED